MGLLTSMARGLRELPVCAPTLQRGSVGHSAWLDRSEAPPRVRIEAEAALRGAHDPDPALTVAAVCILSTPALLGPLRGIRLWHDSRGPSPAWYVSHVMVGELGPGPRRSWIFPAECWLAASREDGRVERELGCLRRGLGFWKVGDRLAGCDASAASLCGCFPKLHYSWHQGGRAVNGALSGPVWARMSPSSGTAAVT